MKNKSIKIELNRNEYNHLDIIETISSNVDIKMTKSNGLIELILNKCDLIDEENESSHGVELIIILSNIFVIDRIVSGNDLSVYSSLANLTDYTKMLSDNHLTLNIEL